MIVIPKKQWPSVKKSILEEYAFDWGEHDEESVIALGYVSIYAHSYSPNAKLEQLHGRTADGSYGAESDPGRRRKSRSTTTAIRATVMSYGLKFGDRLESRRT